MRGEVVTFFFFKVKIVRFQGSGDFDWCNLGCGIVR